MTVSRDPREAPEYLGCSGPQLTSLTTALKSTALARSAPRLPEQTPGSVHDEQHPVTVTTRGEQQLALSAPAPLTPAGPRPRKVPPAAARSPRGGPREQTPPCVCSVRKALRRVSRRGGNGEFFLEHLMF